MRPELPLPRSMVPEILLHGNRKLLTRKGLHQELSRAEQGGLPCQHLPPLGKNENRSPSRLRILPQECHGLKRIQLFALSVADDHVRSEFLRDFHRMVLVLGMEHFISILQKNLRQGCSVEDVVVNDEDLMGRCGFGWWWHPGGFCRRLLSGDRLFRS
jgi:hypothetical protein